MLKAYKYRIYPTPEQTVLIEKSIGCCRLVYNLALQVKMTAYNDAGIKLSAFDLCYQLNALKDEYQWLREVDSQALQAAVKKVDISFKNFFRGNGFPKFKSKSGKQSFQCPNSCRRIDFEKSELTLPKLPNIPIVISRSFAGEIKTVTVSRTPSGKYFASILVDNKVELPKPNPIMENNTIGIDVGLKMFAVLSNGKSIDNPKFLRTSLQRLKCLQRRLSRKNKGSNNRKKAVKKLAIQHEKVANQRKDFLHKFSDAITKQYDTICVEDLNIAGMVKNHKLSQAISDVGWATGLDFIKYKSEWRGKNYIEIGRFEPSSKIHNKCGYKNESLTLTDREWYCPTCNEMVSRDENAAINIKNIGLKNSGWGTSGEPVELPTLVGAMKQEVKPRSNTMVSTNQ